MRINQYAPERSIGVSTLLLSHHSSVRAVFSGWPAFQG